MGLRGYDVGLKLKSTSGWRPGATGTDDYGFTGLPGGERLSRFYAGGSSGFWWSSSEASSSSVYYRNLIFSFEQAARDTHPKRMGFSVRCIIMDTAFVFESKKNLIIPTPRTKK
jgi:uncharacterized protein (TIGR02145 family)